MSRPLADPPTQERLNHRTHTYITLALPQRYSTENRYIRRLLILYKMTSQTHPPLLSDKDGYLGLLNDPSQMTFLLQAWALARRILLIERSVEALVVMLSTKWDDTDAGELPGDVTLLRGAIRGFLSHNQPQFISSMSLDDWGSTRAIWPHHIHLKHSVSLTRKD